MPPHSGAVQTIDERLAPLGRVFISVEPRKKRVRRPRTPDTLRPADDPVLEAYLEAGHGYAVACQNDVAILDADEPEELAPIIDQLPDTVWQITGSREGHHYFLEVPGMDADIPLDDPVTEENIGHVKGAHQSYVLGPGSMHPSGERYGPLQGEAVATISELELRELVAPVTDHRKATIRWATSRTLRRLADAEGDPIGDRALLDVIEPYLDSAPAHDETAGGEGGTSTGTDCHADLDCHDIVRAGKFPEGVRTAHPFHESTTGENFMVDDGAETFRCWSHACTGNAVHLLGMEQGVINCGDWIGGGLSNDVWREIFDAARDDGYDIPIPWEQDAPEEKEGIPPDDRGEKDPPKCPGCHGPLPDRTAVDGNPALRWCHRCRVTRTAAEVMRNE